MAAAVCLPLLKSSQAVPNKLQKHLLEPTTHEETASEGLQGDSANHAKACSSQNAQISDPAWHAKAPCLALVTCRAKGLQCNPSVPLLSNITGVAGDFSKCES